MRCCVNRLGDKNLKIIFKLFPNSMSDIKKAYTLPNYVRDLSCNCSIVESEGLHLTNRNMGQWPVVHLVIKLSDLFLPLLQKFMANPCKMLISSHKGTFSQKKTDNLHKNLKSDKLNGFVSNKSKTMNLVF